MLTKQQKQDLLILHNQFDKDKKMFPVIWYQFNLVPNFRLNTILFGVASIVGLFLTKPDYNFHSSMIVWVMFWAFSFFMWASCCFLIYTFVMMHQFFNILKDNK